VIADAIGTTLGEPTGALCSADSLLTPSSKSAADVMA
jgi:hypothetical protein